MRIHETADAFFNGEKYIQDFVTYWKSHSYPYKKGQNPPIFDEADFMNHFSITSGSGQNLINTDYKVNIVDHESTKFPFMMGTVGGMRLEMAKLNTLEN